MLTMKKRGVLTLFILSFLVLSAFFAAADTNSTASASDKATACVTNQIADKGCSSLSTEEKIFSYLAVGKCKTELLSSMSNNYPCWGASSSSSCSIKTTAQAILALGSGTANSEKWLLSQNQSTSDMNWFLQVESSNSTTCTATYNSGSYEFTINSDKTLAGDAGSCLTPYLNYWFEIDPSCYNYEFKISCSDSFLTSLLYKKSSSSTLYVSDQTHSASGEGTTTEKVNSLCFAQGGNCDYEGTLWAALVLSAKKYDVSAFIPYLIAFSDENPSYLPYSFLYTLTNNYKTDLLALQQEKKWWIESGDKFYDTAVALLPFQNQQLTEKTNAQNWLLDIQGTDGCWQSNLRDTAFLIYVLWPKNFGTVAVTTSDCATSNYYCMSSASCSSVSGNVLDTYGGCFGTSICCDKPAQLQTCVDQGGELCDSSKSEQCLGGTTLSSSDTTSTASCCVKGVCGQAQVSECETNGGTCEESCLSGQQSASYACGSFNLCCVAKKTSYTWLIILLVVLIILVALGIIYRNKLRDWFSKFQVWIKSKFSKGGKPAPSNQGPKFPPTPSSRVYPGAVQRRIIPQQQARPQVRPQPQAKSDFDDVLQKLKDIGK